MGAAMFANADQATIASHSSEGPPLKTFLFPPPSLENDQMHEYCRVTAEAFEDLLVSYPGLTWDNR